MSHILNFKTWKGVMESGSYPDPASMLILEEECKASPDWLSRYQIDGKTGKPQCSNWDWRIAEPGSDDSLEYLWINFNSGFLALGILSNSVDEAQLQELLQLFGMTAAQPDGDGNFRFQYNFTDSESGGDLNQQLDRLQGGKIPWIQKLP